MDLNLLTATRIKDLRNSLGLSAKFVAAELNTSQSSYSDLENGKVEITLTKLEALAQVFSLPIENIIYQGDKSSTINVSHGENGVSGTQINNYTDKDLVNILRSSIETMITTQEVAKVLLERMVANE